MVNRWCWCQNEREKDIPGPLRAVYIDLNGDEEGQAIKTKNSISLPKNLEELLQNEARFDRAVQGSEAGIWD